jgi:hypothetical protein
MTGDHYGQTAGMATLLVRAVDGILGTHRSANSTTFQVTELMPLRLQHGDRGACRRRRQWAVIGICPLAVTEISLYLHGM